MTEMRNDDDQSQTIYINIYFRKFEFELCMYEYCVLILSREILFIRMELFSEYCRDADMQKAKLNYFYLYLFQKV